jgi:hypothetical protein
LLINAPNLALTFDFFFTGPSTSEAYSRNDFTATCYAVKLTPVGRKNITNKIVRFLINLKGTFPYITERATGNGKLSNLADVSREVSQRCFRGNQW